MCRVYDLLEHQKFELLVIGSESTCRRSSFLTAEQSVFKTKRFDSTYVHNVDHLENKAEGGSPGCR